MKPTITRRKTVRGRPAGYVATLGPIETSDMHTDRASAIETCERSVRSALERLDQGARITRWRDHIIVITPTIVGWAYWLDTFGASHYLHGTAGSLTACEQSAHSHLAQNLWTAAEDDHAFLADVLDPAVRSELAGWIAFQRCHASILAAGEIRDSGKIHQAACEMSYTYRAEHFGAYVYRSANPSPVRAGQDGR